MPFLNNAPGGGDLWAPAEGAGGDDATLNDLLALYQSANDVNPPFSPLADAGAVGGTPSFGGSSSAVDAEIDELIRSFQDTPPPFSGAAAPAGAAISTPPAPPIPVAPPVPAAPEPPIVMAPAAPPAPPPLPAAAAEPPIVMPPPPPPPAPEPPIVMAPPAPPPPPTPPAAEAPIAMPPPPPPPAAPEPPIAMPPPPPAPEPPIAMPPPPPPVPEVAIAMPAPPAAEPTSATMTIPVAAVPVSQPAPAAYASESAVQPYVAPDSPANVNVETSRDRLALAQQLTEVIANLANGVDQVQGQLDGLYGNLADAATSRAPVQDILHFTQALQDAKAQVGEDSALYQQALLLKQVGEAYMHLLRTL